MGGWVPKNKRITSSGISRRFSICKSRPQCAEKPDELRSKCFAKSRLVRKSREVSSTGYTKHRVSRHRVGHKCEREKVTRRENNSITSRLRKSIEEMSMVVAARNFAYRPIGICSHGDSSGSLVHQTYSKGRSKASTRSAQSTLGNTTSCCQRLSLVDFKRESARENLHSRANDICDDGCIRRRLGCSDWRLSSDGKMVKRASCLAHKQERVVHRAHCSKRMPEYCSRPINYGSIRQQNGGFIPEESGRYQVCDIVRRDQKHPVTCQEPRSNDSIFLSARSLQLYSRLLVEGKKPSGLACHRRGHDENILKVGYPSDRSVCHQPIESSADVCFDRSMGHRGIVHQRIQSELELPTGMGLPSSTFNTQSASPPQPVLGNLPFDGSPLGNCVLEGGPEAESPRSSLSNTQCQQEFDRPVHQSLTAKSRRVLFRGLAHTGWSELIADLDPDDIDLVQSAWRDSTWRTYESAWKQWISWCRQNGKSPSSPRPQDVATYLAFLSRVRKLATSTILVHKSVVLTLADPTQEKRLAGHPLVTAIVKAIGIKQFASLPTKSKIWNIKDLIGWLRSHSPTEDSIFQVSRHAALLLLLASGRRIHDLTLLSIDEEHCDRSSTTITFWPRFGSKTDNMKNRQSGWQLSDSGDPDLSLVKWVNCLIDLSGNRRGARSDLHSLFITTRGEVKAASRSVISGWLKAPFLDLGIKCSPGSIRSAVASNDFHNNVPLDSILKRGNWRGSETFFKHYCKSVEFPRAKNCNDLNDSFTAV